jgi:cystathionine beta-lyase
VAGLKDRWDALSVEELRRRRGGEKWSQYPDCIGAFVAEMDFGTAPAVEEALRDAIERAAFGYMSDPLVAELGEACAALYADRWGWSPPADWIRPVADVIKAAEIAIQLYSPPGSAVILPTPNYMPFLKLPGQLGRELIEVPMRRSGRWQFDLEAIERAFRQGGHTLLLCNPANPLGRVFERDELLALAQVVDRNGGRVFADEIHAAITYPGHQHIPYASLSPATAAHTVTAFSASKAWNVPGLKCAQLLFSNEADRAIWEERGAYFGYGASTLGVTANIAAFRAGGPWQAEVMEYLAGNRQRFGEILADQAPDIPYSPPEGTYLAWLDLRDFARRKGIAAGAGELSAWFRRETGVAMTDGADCGGAGRGFLRFNFALPRPILEGAALAVARAIAAPPHH